MKDPHKLYTFINGLTHTFACTHSQQRINTEEVPEYGTYTHTHTTRKNIFVYFSFFFFFFCSFLFIFVGRRVCALLLTMLLRIVYRVWTEQPCILLSLTFTCSVFIHTHIETPYILIQYSLHSIFARHCRHRHRVVFLLYSMNVILIRFIFIFKMYQSVR